MVSIYMTREFAQLYATYRPLYPKIVYDNMFRFLDDDGLSQKQQQQQPKRRKVVLDVGCGSGQNTRVLAEHFERVVAVDMSEGQLEEARIACSSHDNITFRQGTAEDIAFLSAGSVDLVTAATALHLFKVKPFYESCWTVLKPGGVLTAFAYIIEGCDNAEATVLFKEFFVNVLDDANVSGIRHIASRYEELFSILKDVFSITKRNEAIVSVGKQSLKQLSGFINSMASYRSYAARLSGNLQSPLEQLVDKLKTIYGIESEDEPAIEVLLDVFMIFGKKT